MSATPWHDFTSFLSGSVVVTDSSCGTSNDRVNEAVKKKEVQITFHSSLSYGDRLFLKKGREDCSKSLSRESQMRIGNKGEKRDRLNEHNFTDKNMEKEDKPHHKSVDYFPPNYREMIQSIAQTKSDQNGKTCSQDLLSQHTVSIRELSPLECNSNEDKGTTCLVEECDEESRETQIRPVSRHGRLSIQEMSTTGNFSEPTETELNSCVNSSSSPKLVSSSINSKTFLITPTRQAKEKKLSTRNSSAGRIHSKKFLANKDEEYKTPGIPAYQAWKPKPCYKELTDFFLAGVEKDNERKKFAGNGSNFTSSSSITGDLSRNCLSTTWQPQRSLPLTTTNTTDIPLPVQMKGRNFPTSSQSTDLKEKDSGGPKEDNFHRGKKKNPLL